MSDNEDWRRELAERLHPNTDWTVRPVPRRAAPPIAHVTPVQEHNIAPAPNRASTESCIAVPVDHTTPTAHPSPAPVAAEAQQMSDVQIWPYVVAALAMLAAAGGWVFVHRVAGSPSALVTAQVATTPNSAATAVHPASLAADDTARCDATLAAPVLSALFRRGTAFDGAVTRGAAPATLGAVRLLTADGSTAVCRGVLELQLADVRAASPVLQIVSGPVDYAVDGGASASVPTFRVVRARSIFHRLETMPATGPVAVPAARPAAKVVAIERANSIRVAPAAMRETIVRPMRPAAVHPLRPIHEAAEAAALPTTAETRSPQRAKAELMASPVTKPDPATEVTRASDERAADSAAAQAIYVAIARSGDPQAIEAADEGRDLYLRQSHRCATPGCADVAYKRWLTRLRDIDERSRSFVKY